MLASSVRSVGQLRDQGVLGFRMCTVTGVESRLEGPLKMEAALKDSREEREGKPLLITSSKVEMERGKSHQRKSIYKK